MTGVRGWRRDVLIAAAVFAVSSLWGAQFWDAWQSQGNEPEFYQSYYEPAVMVACGKGFVTSNLPPPALADFLERRRDSFSCSELPPNLTVGRDALVTEAWTYLQYTVGWSWRILGISWSGMSPLFGLFFGTVTALVYAISRLGMRRPLAAFCAAGVATSSLHLINLPHLRDYSKAPFTLALILILGVLVASPLKRGRLIGLALAYGAILGLGYGFRTDLLINLPLIAVTLFLFVEGPLRGNLLLKTAATVTAFAAFAAASWPITSAVYSKGGCQWHVALLGLQLPFDSRLRIQSAPYDFGYVYADGFVIRGVQGFAQRSQPAVARPVYCSHEYDVFSGRYLAAIVTAFPADLVARAYAATGQVLEAAYQPRDAPAKEWWSTIFKARRLLLRPFESMGVLLASACVLVASAISVRLGLFVLFFAAYFGGYPAVQFQERHYFHLEFMGLWALGFLIDRAVTLAGAWRKGHAPSPREVRTGVVRATLVAATGLIAAVAMLGALRWYQEREARELFRAYIDAPKMRLDDPAAPLPESDRSDWRQWPQYLEVDLDQSVCGPQPSVTFHYDANDRDGNFTRTMKVERASTGPGLTRLLLPVFESYTGLEFSDLTPGCVLGAYRFSNLQALPLLVGATLPPDWQSLPLYARLGR